MYKELIEKLRCCVEQIRCGDCRYVKDCDGDRMMMSEAADAIEDLIKALTASNEVISKSKPRWIPVTERLPEEDTDVLVVRKFLGVKGQVPPSTYVEIASRYEDDWTAATDEYKIARSKHTNPLYWMPLPEPPKEE